MPAKRPSWPSRRWSNGTRRWSGASARPSCADEHQAEDAFQATFLVLVRKARSLWVRDSLGPWLNQVACRTATCLRATVHRRRRHEQRRAARDAARIRRSRDTARSRSGCRGPRGVEPAAGEISGAGRSLRPGRPHAPGGGAVPRLADRDRQEPPISGPQTAAGSAGAARIGTRRRRGRHRLVEAGGRRGDAEGGRSERRRCRDASIGSCVDRCRGSGSRPCPHSRSPSNDVLDQDFDSSPVAALVVGIATGGASVYVRGSQEPAKQDGQPVPKRPTTTAAAKAEQP